MANKDSSTSQFSSFKRIGLFDSGVGGLSVLKKLTQLPSGSRRSFVYLGDTARCPYGNRPTEEIALFVHQIVKWLGRQEVDAIVMACNTSAAVARAIADQSASVPVFDLISATAQYVSAAEGTVGIMATASTARSRAFSKAISGLNPDKSVIEYGCPELVPIVETGAIHAPETKPVLNGYIERMRKDGVKNVVLGCTHFPFLRSELEMLAGGDLNFIDPAEILTGIYSNAGNPLDRTELYVTGSPRPFARAAQIALDHMPPMVKRISVDDLEAFIPDYQFAIHREAMVPHAVSTVVQ